MRMKFLAILLIMASAVSCCFNNTGTTNNQTEMKKDLSYVKKYTNKDYYQDGKLQADVVLKAYEEMLAHYGVELSEFMRKNLFISDFELGDFENLGMAGFFWVNDPKANYFAHEIYLLPGQMIVEHRHVPTDFPAKMESWLVQAGSCYNFSTGDPTPNPPALPKSQADYNDAKAFVVQNVGEIVHLNNLEDPHFLYAGDGGALIMEFASYHDGNGLRFSNPNVVFTDVLSQ